MEYKEDHETRSSAALSRRKFLTACAGAAAAGLAPTVLARTTGTGAKPLIDTGASHGRFTRLAMNNYGPFRGVSELRFTPGLNVIVGSGGTGKTAILDALASTRGEPGFEVATDGNRELLSRYRDLIFVPEDWMDRGQLPLWDELAWDGDNFTPLGEALWLQLKLESGKVGPDSTPPEARAGYFDRTFLYMAGMVSLLAARDRLDLDLPLVMERPFSRLQRSHAELLTEWLVYEPAQVILLVRASELRPARLPRPDWLLKRHGNHSRIRKFRAKGDAGLQSA